MQKINLIFQNFVELLWLRSKFGMAGSTSLELRKKLNQFDLTMFRHMQKSAP